MSAEFHQNKIAIVYDFDGTLSPEAMQHYGVLPLLDIKPSDFWQDVKNKRKKQSAEELLVYMREMIKRADHLNVKLDRDSFKEHGAKISFFLGVETWFDRINGYVSQISDEAVEVRHYIISSGLKEMIEGCKIADHFERVYACEFIYDHYGHPVWPARIISDSSKTQYLFRINKGILDVNDPINGHMPNEDRPIPFDNMLYLGDGDTDVPSMAVMMQNGGHAIAVHPTGQDCSNKCRELKNARRIDFYCEADYREGSDLDGLVKNTLDVIVSRILLRKRISEKV